jgi:hypothetical protein
MKKKQLDSDFHSLIELINLFTTSLSLTNYEISILPVYKDCEYRAAIESNEQNKQVTFFINMVWLEKTKPDMREKKLLIFHECIELLLSEMTDKLDLSENTISTLSHNIIRRLEHFVMFSMDNIFKGDNDDKKC